MKSIAVIPARMGSSRFPGKPLAPLHGRTMLEHVYRRTELCPALAETVVATCDIEIRDAVEAFGGRAIMTADTHERASDRMAEAAGSNVARVFDRLYPQNPLFGIGELEALYAADPSAFPGADGSVAQNSAAR